MGTNVWATVGGVAGYLPLSALTGLTGQLLGMNLAADLAEWKAVTFLADQMAVPVGAEATPSYTFTGDLNTGLFQDGADILAFAAGGIKRMRLKTTEFEMIVPITMNQKLIQEDKSALDQVVLAGAVDFGAVTGNYVGLNNGAINANLTTLGGAALPAGTVIETKVNQIIGGAITVIHNAALINTLTKANTVLADGDVLRWRKVVDGVATWDMVSHQGNSTLGQLVVPKLTTETVNNSVALQDDNLLKFPMKQVTTYMFEIILHMRSTAAADFKFSFTAPAATVYFGLSWGARNTVDNLFGASGAVGTVNVVNITSVAVDTVIHIVGVIENGINAGDFVLQWAQNAAVVADTQVLKGSRILYKVMNS